MRVFPNSLIDEDFFRLFWQKQPLLVRQALSLPAGMVTKAQLFNLACGSDEVESRLVIEHGETPWEVHHGPFEPGELQQLPDSHWTLLVQDMNRHMPETSALLDAFKGIPRWRVDDIMISYAVDQGSVGPHTDEYDVFLIQAAGNRRWKIHRRPVNHDDLIPDLDIQVLNKFDAEQEWLLEPGDMLYLPPNVAHWGVAEGECITWSVGFRGPDVAELCGHWLEERLAALSRQRYSDPDLLKQQHSGEITPPAIGRIKQMLQRALRFSDAELAAWFGGFISEPKAHLSPPPAPVPLTPDSLLHKLQHGSRLQRHPFANLYYTSHPNTLLLFASGESLPLAAGATGLAQLLTEKEVYSLAQLQPWLQQIDTLQLLTELVNRGDLLLSKVPAE